MFCSDVQYANAPSLHQDQAERILGGAALSKTLAAAIRNINLPLPLRDSPGRDQFTPHFPIRQPFIIYFVENSFFSLPNSPFF